MSLLEGSMSWMLNVFICATSRCFYVSKTMLYIFYSSFTNTINLVWSSTDWFSHADPKPYSFIMWLYIFSDILILRNTVTILVVFTAKGVWGYVAITYITCDIECATEYMPSTFFRYISRNGIILWRRTKDYDDFCCLHATTI